MDQNPSWSLSFGRWVGVPVRVHVLLLLFVAFIFCVDFNSLPTGARLLSTGLVTTAVLLASVILHELAHIFVIHNVGGVVHNVTFMPWGGNSTFEYPAQRSWRLVTIMAGPFVNLCVFLFGAALLAHSSEVNLISLLHPFRPHRYLAGEAATSLIQITTWVNFQLFIVNLLPCFPFDGAEALRTAMSFLQKNIPQYRVEAAIRVTGTAVALTLVGLGWVFKDYAVGPVQPIWFLLLASGICLYFSARFSYYAETFDESDQWDDAQSALGFADEYSDSQSCFVFGGTDEDSDYSKWLVEKQEARSRDELYLEQQEIELADEVLEKLHGHGLESLTADEKKLLQRVSERLRRKRKLDVID